VASVLERRPRIHFVLIGHGVDESNLSLITEIRNRNIFQQLHLLGTRRDVRSIMPALDVLVLSSAFGEGFPNVLGEAMAAGIPSIVTKVGDTAMVVGDTGRVVNAKDSAGLAAAIADLVDMPVEERRRLGCAARRRIEECFSLPSVVRQYELLYDELTTGIRDDRSPQPSFPERWQYRGPATARTTETLRPGGTEDGHV
jgi:glycosyltransferase involved in cell wall biosynthesis